MEHNHLPRNCHPNRPLESVDGAVVHFISDRFRHPDDSYSFDHIYQSLVELGLSYHVYIPRQGRPIELLPKHLEAWHAGYSRMNDRDYCNKFTRGVALAGTPSSGYTDDQLIHLGQYLAVDMSENRYTTDWIRGHSEVRQAWNETYPDRADDPKPDPGNLMPWGQLWGMLEGVDIAVRIGQLEDWS